MNPLLPPGRTTPIAAYIALHSTGPFANAARTRGVTAATTRAGPVNGAGVSSALLGGTTTVQDLGFL